MFSHTTKQTKMSNYFTLNIHFPDGSKIIMKDIPNGTTIDEVKYSILENQKTKNLNSDFYFQKNGNRLTFDTIADVGDIYVTPIVKRQSMTTMLIFILLTIAMIYMATILINDVLLLCFALFLYSMTLYDFIKLPMPKPSMKGVVGFFYLVISSFSPEFKLENVLINE